MSDDGNSETPTIDRWVDYLCERRVGELVARAEHAEAQLAALRELIRDVLDEPRSYVGWRERGPAARVGRRDREGAMTPEREREIRDVQARMEARAPSMGLHAAAARMALPMSRDLLAEIDRLRAAHERLRGVCLAILPRLHEDEAVTLGSALGDG